MATILIPLPNEGFDPTEVAVPWVTLKKAGHRVLFTTPAGAIGAADPIMLTGKGLGIWKSVLACDKVVRKIYLEMEKDSDFLKPFSYADAAAKTFDLILLPGGHAKGVRPYLESTILQHMIASQDASDRLLAAICHGVVLMGRSKRSDGKSVLHGRKTTAILNSQERLAWQMTRLWMGDYYRTYPEITVQNEVTSYLADPADFIEGPLPLLRDNSGALQRGFVVIDRNYISARWPGDAHRFSQSLVDALESMKHS